MARAQVDRPGVCAVYTRQSVRTESDLTSCQVQRELCADFAVGKGFQLVEEQFDDEGYSDASLDRPARRKLLIQVRRGQIHAVAVQEQERAQIRREIDQRGAELRAQVAANQARLDGERRAMGLPTHEELRTSPELALAMRRRPAQTGASPALEISSKPKAEPVQRELFDGLTAGTERSAVVKKLGEPHGQIGNLGSDGDEESLTYLVVGGRQANVRLKGGKVVAVRLP